MSQENEITTIVVPPVNDISNLRPAIRRPRDPQFTLYYIQPYQLKAFEKGATDSKMFTIGLALISAAVGLGGSMITTTPFSNTFWIFAVLIFGCLVGGVILLIISKKDKNEITELVNEIKQQHEPPPGEQIQ